MTRVSENGAASRLAVYGTLGPGRPNHHQLADIPGVWLKGQVRGRLVEEGWGATEGYPGLILDETAPPIQVDILISDELATHWPRLDAFEGDGYYRAVATADTAEGPLAVSIYVVG